MCWSQAGVVFALDQQHIHYRYGKAGQSTSGAEGSMKRRKSDSKVPVRVYKSRARSAVTDSDAIGRALGIWSDAEAEKVTGDVVALIGKEPQDVVESNDYDDVTGELKIGRMPGRKHMQSQLQEIAARYHFEVAQHARPAAGQIIKKLQSIESAAQRMLKALGVDQRAPDALESVTPRDLRYALQGQAALMAEQIGGFSNHPPTVFDLDGDSYQDWHHQAQLRDVIVGIRQLQAWAQGARERQSNKQLNRGTALGAIATGPLHCVRT
jgi:hypothetical protein